MASKKNSKTEKTVKTEHDYVDDYYARKRPPDLQWEVLKSHVPESLSAVILAAGMATRMRPLTWDTPKCLLKIGERCLLERAIDALLRFNLKELCIVTGYKAEMIREFVSARYPDLSVTYIHNPEYEHTNNIYSLWLARPFADGRDIILLDSDIIFDPEIISRLMIHGNDNVLSYIEHPCGPEEVKLFLGPEGEVVEIGKHARLCTTRESIGIERFAGYFMKGLYRELEVMIELEWKRDVYYEAAFDRLTTNPIYAICTSDVTGYFAMELDTVEDFENAKQLIPEYLY